jgi:hypothetical protein
MERGRTTRDLVAFRKEASCKSKTGRTAHGVPHTETVQSAQWNETVRPSLLFEGNREVVEIEDGSVTFIAAGWRRRHIVSSGTAEVAVAPGGHRGLIYGSAAQIVLYHEFNERGGN